MKILLDEMRREREELETKKSFVRDAFLDICVCFFFFLTLSLPLFENVGAVGSETDFGNHTTFKKKSLQKIIFFPQHKTKEFKQKK